MVFEYGQPLRTVQKNSFNSKNMKLPVKSVQNYRGPVGTTTIQIDLRNHSISNVLDDDYNNKAHVTEFILRNKKHNWTCNFLQASLKVSRSHDNSNSIMSSIVFYESDWCTSFMLMKDLFTKGEDSCYTK